jgi:hypothetical protein
MLALGDGMRQRLLAVPSPLRPGSPPSWPGSKMLEQAGNLEARPGDARQAELSPPLGELAAWSLA